MKKMLLIVIFLLLAPQTFANFSDIGEEHLYYKSINYAKENNIVNGYHDGTFKPENKITREEFTKIIIKSNFSDEEIYGEDCFSDVNEGYFEKYICTAKRKGIISGYNNKTFKPKNNISFLEAAKIILIGLGRKEQVGNEKGLEKYGKYLSKEKIIPTSIYPIDSKITRGEMVEIIWRLKEKIDTKDYFVFEDDKLCIPAGQYSGFYPNVKTQPTCCNGLKKTSHGKERDKVYNLCLPGTGGFLCIPCGNGICEPEFNETDCNCQEDCSK